MDKLVFCKTGNWISGLITGKSILDIARNSAGVYFKAVSPYIDQRINETTVSIGNLFSGDRNLLACRQI